MDNLNYRFFEEFKHLDRLCGEVYKTQYGITHYIDDMKSKPFNNIPNWDSDLRQLIRLRHIRNKMAHEENAFDNADCTQNDIEWIRYFYKRIMNQTDPLAMLYKKSKVENQKVKVINHINRIPERQSNRQTVEKPKEHRGAGIFLFVFIAIALMAVVIAVLGLLI